MSVSIAQAVALMKKNIRKKRNLAFSLITSQVIETSPVKKGDYRASHSPNNSAEFKEGNITSDHYRNRHSYAEVINSVPDGGSYSLSNHLPYAEKIEFTSHSQQGTLIYTRAIENWTDHVEDAIKQVGEP